MTRCRIVLAFVLALSAGIAPASDAGSPSARPPAPSPHCFDARDVREAVQSDPQTIALRLGDESRYRLELAEACPGALRRDRVKIASRHGWVCGSNEEQVTTGDRRCALSGIAKIDARQFAELALRSKRPVADGGDLETIEVRSKRRHGFGGTTAYCLDARHMRGWREDGSDIIVEMSPRRSGGHRYYRVELASSCGERTSASALHLESPTGGTAICGNPGDRAMFSVASGGASAPGTLATRFAGSLAAQAGCAIKQVYPILPEEKQARR
jgi:hypothetical protein